MGPPLRSMSEDVGQVPQLAMNATAHAMLIGTLRA
jgi:hypothetical protein